MENASEEINESKRLSKSDKNKAMIYKALTDLDFRRTLEKNPAKALGIDADKMTAENFHEVKFVLTMVKGVNNQISQMADALLCKNGPCGVVAADFSHPVNELKSRAKTNRAE